MDDSTPTAGAGRKIGVAADLSKESSDAVRWAVHHHLRPGDTFILLHLNPIDTDSNDIVILAKPLVDAQIPYNIHNVNDQNINERLCLEVERLRLDALIISSHSGLIAVADYCVHHCLCPVVLVKDDQKEKKDDKICVIYSLYGKHCFYVFDVGTRVNHSEPMPLPREVLK
ncbi:universal stress protein PHOS32-like [Castanea sativa]|uniref:universal stress protein PHOS32-like n=1 Tax=Castanea sativa TaxID=21020 RepID=UPI003F6538D6